MEERAKHGTKRRICTWLAALAFVVAASSQTFAATQTVHGIGLYQMGESETIQQAKEKAKEDALFASGEIRQIASVEKRQFGSAEIRQFESIEKSQS